MPKPVIRDAAGGHAACRVSIPPQGLHVGFLWREQRISVFRTTVLQALCYLWLNLTLTDR